MAKGRKLYSRRSVVLLNWLQRKARSSEVLLVVLAAGIGAIAGVATMLIGAIARTLQHIIFHLPPDGHLSATASFHFSALLALPIGGLVLAGLAWASRARERRLVDTVEANALYGGRMSLTDSMFITAQTIVSNGFGASVGLEAAYAQMGGAVASEAGQRSKLRRADIRLLVGAGAGASIASAFGAPLVGAFYAFETVIGAYTPSAIAPVVAASLTATLVSQALGAKAYIINIASLPPMETSHYFIYGALGLLAALIGIALMRAVAFVEHHIKRLPLPEYMRPVIGGALLIPLAFASPQILSAGHSALYVDLAIGLPIALLLFTFLAKAVASVISLGFGFRGGLFFASLFLGTLLGHIFADALTLASGHMVVDPVSAALVGMAALSVAIVGGPMTMTMLVLEATHNFALTGAVLAASLVSSTLVRELFGFSFSTWRLHLRGEAVKSARDVGWVKNLTAGNMMRRTDKTVSPLTSIEEFRRRFPLGSTSRVVLADSAGKYAGIVATAEAFSDNLNQLDAVGSLAKAEKTSLSPSTDVMTVMRMFDTYGGDELAVVDRDRHVLGIVSESYVHRRYAEEIEKAQRELFGET